MDRKTSTFEQVENRLQSLIKLAQKLDSRDEVSQKSTCHRVLHHRGNPYQNSLKEKECKLMELRNENEKLRARLDLLEAGNDADITRRIDDAIDQTHQVDTLLRRITDFENRELKIRDSFRKTSSEFRTAIYLLTGYKVYALRGATYRLTHVYANRDEELKFQVIRDGTIKLLPTNMSKRFGSQFKTYVEEADSYPAFLASITLDLFKVTSNLSPMSVCMSIMDAEHEATTKQ